jgi:hypothetical protein
LSDADGLLFLAFYLGVPILGPACFVALCVVAIVQWRRNRRDLLHGQQARETREARAAREAGSA